MRVKIRALLVCNRAKRQRYDSIGRTVLQTVSQKLYVISTALDVSEGIFAVLYVSIIGLTRFYTRAQQLLRWATIWPQ